MKKSSPSALELREAASTSAGSILDLELPVEPDFDSRPPQLTPPRFVAWCEEMMDLSPEARDESEGQLTVRAEFIL